MSDNDWKDGHLKVIADFLQYLNACTDQFVLKGGTALMMCYGLDRFSEDIDLNCKKQDIREIVRRFCDSHHFEYKVAKDTATVKRCFIDYGNPNHKLKVEVSYRKNTLADQSVRKIKGIVVYDINQMAMLKCNAYLGRDRIRDLYDLCFIFKNYEDDLSLAVKNQLTEAFGTKGIEQIEYLLETQPDELIDKNRLFDDFFEINEKLGLITDS